MSCHPRIWAILPADAQRVLCGRQEARGLDLSFNDDGTPIGSPAAAGEALFLVLVSVADMYTAIQCATKLVETLTRKEHS
jgi:hypothetical protein